MPPVALHVFTEFAATRGNGPGEAEFMMAEILDDALYMLASTSLSMSQKAQPETKSVTGPAALDSYFPFFSEIYRYQSALPALVSAEQELLRAIAASDGALDPDQRIR